MKHELATALVNIHNELNPSARNDATLYENYSGRGMYGNTTTGITGASLSELMSSLIIAITSNQDATIEELESVDLSDIPQLRFKTDSLGLDEIIY